MEALQISIPVWNITELNGYEPITTFWQDFRLLTNSGLQPLKTLTDVSNQNGKQLQILDRVVPCTQS